MADQILAALRAKIKASAGKFYVYILSRPDGRPFYVGAGSEFRAIMSANPKRCENPIKRAVIEKIIRNGGHTQIVLTAWFDVWEDALSEETRLIAYYGRIDIGTGILTNNTNGGEGTRGIVRVISEETRRKMSEGQRRRDPATFNREGLMEWRAANIDKIASTQSNLWKAPEYRERMKDALRGVKRRDGFSEENRRRQLLKFQDPNWKAKWAEARRLGIQTIDTREKMSDAAKNRAADPSYREQQSERSKQLWADKEFREKMMAARRAGKKPGRKRIDPSKKVSSAEKQRAYRLANPERHRAKRRVWRLANPEKARESDRRWRERQKTKRISGT